MATQKINEIFDIPAIQQQVSEVKSKIESVITDIESFSRRMQSAMKEVGNVSSYRDISSASEKLNQAQREYEKTLGNLKKLQEEEIQLKNKLNQAYQQQFARIEEVRSNINQEAEAIRAKTKAQSDSLKQTNTISNQQQREIQSTNASSSAARSKAESYTEMAKEASVVIGTINQNIARLTQEQAALKAVKDELSILNKTQENGQRLTQSQKERKLELINAEFRHKQAISELNQTIKNEIKIDQAASSSMDGMTASLGRLRIAYRNLTKEERESEFGKQLLAQIKTTDKNLKDLNASLGNHQGNVGNYASAWKGMQKYMLGAIGVIAGVKSALRGVSSVILSTQQTGDSFNFTLKSLESTWDLFKKSMATADFSLFIRNAGDAAEAGRKLAEVLDESFEIENSIRLRRAKDAKQLALLRDKLDDVNIASRERIEAGEQYKEMVEKVYNEEIEKLNKIAEARKNSLASQVKGKNDKTEDTADRLKEFIEQYNLNKKLIKQAKEFIDIEDELDRTKERHRETFFSGFAKEMEELQKAIDNTPEDVKKFAATMRQYNLSNDEQVKSIVDSYEKLYNAQAAFSNETRRITRALNTAKKLSRTELKAEEEASLMRLKATQDYYSYVYNNERKSYDERKEALISFNEGQIELIKRQGEVELLGTNLTERQKVYIRQKTNDEVEKEEREAADRMRVFEEKQAAITNQLNEANLQGRISLFQRAYTDENNSFEKRIEALENFGLTQNELLESQHNFRLSTLVEGSNEALLAEQEYANKVTELEANLTNEREKLKLEEVGKRIEATDTLKSAITDEYNEELRLLAQRYSGGLMSQERYEAERSALSARYNKQIFDNEIETLEEIVRNSGLYGEELANMERQLARKKLEYNEWVNQQIIASDEQLAQRRRELSQEVYNFIGSFADSMFERRINNLDGEISKIEEWKEAQLSSIDELNVSEEEREAKRKVIEQQADQRQEKLEKERKKVQRTQAKMEKAFSLLQIGIESARAIHKITVEAAAARAIPFIGEALAAKALAQIPFVLTSTALQTAAILAKPLPQYAKGTEDHPGGLAIVGDGGKKEVIKTPEGGYYITPSSPIIVDLPKHSEVMPDFSKIFSSITDMPNYKQDIDEIKAYDYTRLEKKFDELTEKIEEIARKNKTQLNIGLDKNGVWSAYEKTKGRTTYMNERLNLRR